MISSSSGLRSPPLFYLVLVLTFGCMSSSFAAMRLYLYEMRNVYSLNIVYNRVIVRFSRMSATRICFLSSSLEHFSASDTLNESSNLFKLSV